MRARNSDSLGQLRAELLETLGQPCRWTALPGLLDRLDAIRIRQMSAVQFQGSFAGLHERAWVDSFSGELAQQQPSVDADAAKRAARELMPWLGVYDPVALARGSWMDLPKSYA